MTQQENLLLGRLNSDMLYDRYFSDTLQTLSSIERTKSILSLWRNLADDVINLIKMELHGDLCCAENSLIRQQYVSVEGVEIAFSHE